MSEFDRYERTCKQRDEITPGTPVVPMLYDDYRQVAQNCDLILHTPTSYGGRAIARHTGGPGYEFCHVEAVVWWRYVERLMTCGYQEGRGGTARPLSKIVDQKSGEVHVYRVPERDWFTEAEWSGDVPVPHTNTGSAKKQCVAEHLAGDLGEEYGWSGILLQFLSLLPLARFLLPQKTFLNMVLKASRSSGYGICSQHVARSFAQCGVSLIDKPFALVTPNDIAQSARTEYVCTLVGGTP